MGWQAAITGFGIGIGVFLAILILRNFGAFQFLELKIYDKWCQYQPASSGAGTSIVLIAIDDTDIAGLHQSQISDHRLASLLAQLAKLKARAIGVDLVRDMPVPDVQRYSTDGNSPVSSVAPAGEATTLPSAELKAVLKRYANIVTIAAAAGVDQEDQNQIVIDAPDGCPDQQVGFANLLEDEDNVVRRALLFMDVKNNEGGTSAMFSFPMQLALLSLKHDKIAPPSFEQSRGRWIGKLGAGKLVRLEADDGQYVDADSGGFQIMMDYRRKEDFPVFHLRDCDLLKTSDIADKIVIIGKQSKIDKDFVNTPRRNNEFGMVAHAMVLDQLLRTAKNGSSAVSGKWTIARWLWILLWSFGGAWLGSRLLPIWWFAVFLVLGVIALPAYNFGLFNLGIWLPLVAPLFAFFFATSLSMASFADDRRAYVELLNRTSPELATIIRKNPRRWIKGGMVIPRRTMVTVLFTDMEGFSKVADKTDEGKLMKWLNQYMEKLSPLVANNGGIVNKYMGDSIMAVFGVAREHATEQDRASDARAAVKCALEMRKAANLQVVTWDMEGEECVKTRIGVYSGPAVAGSIGTPQRLEYTVTGTTVNIASRLESLDKENKFPENIVWKDKGRILIGDETRRLIGEAFELFDLGPQELRIDRKISVHAVLRAKQTATVDAAESSNPASTFARWWQALVRLFSGPRSREGI